MRGHFDDILVGLTDYRFIVFVIYDKKQIDIKTNKFDVNNVWNIHGKVCNSMRHREHMIGEIKTSPAVQ